jgi:hypothetical protein
MIWLYSISMLITEGIVCWCMYIFFSMFTSILSLQTTAVKSFLIPEWVSPCFSHLLHGSRFCDILYLLGLTVSRWLSFRCVRSWYKSGDDKQPIHSLCQCPTTFCQLFYNCVFCCHICGHTYHIWCPYHMCSLICYIIYKFLLQNKCIS